MGSVGRLSALGKRAADRLDERRLSSSLRDNWVAQLSAISLTDEEQGRLRRDRHVIVPWLQATRPLAGSRVLEIGCGAGVSTIAMVEQGASVTGLDVSEDAVLLARSRFDDLRMGAEFVTGNAAELQSQFTESTFDWIIYWAALEHMTIDERLSSLAGAREVLRPGGLLTVIETPNRLWYFDSHTSRLPYFMWLPDDLAYRAASASERVGFGDRYVDPELRHMDEFRRRGRGVSYHEFDVAIGQQVHTDMLSCLQLERRRRNVLRRLGWRLSRAGRYEALLASLSPSVSRAFFQPMLYFTLEME